MRCLLRLLVVLPSLLFLCLLGGAMMKRMRPLMVVHGERDDGQAHSRWVVLHAGRIAFGRSSMPDRYLPLARDLADLKREVAPIQEQVTKAQEELQTYTRMRPWYGATPGSERRRKALQRASSAHERPGIAAGASGRAEAQ